MICDVCFHHCDIKEGQRGMCLSRGNEGGHIVSLNYGQITALALEPIEKKPLKRFYPSSLILSVGSFGCNLKCPFCQNHEISYDNGREVQIRLTPAELIQYADKLKNKGNIGIAFTYNEPLVYYEYILDTFKLAKAYELKTVIVTNGTISEKYLQRLLPYTDAMNIDLKGFKQDIYDQLRGDLQTVRHNIVLARQYCHVEVTSLIVPTLNDDPEDMKEEALWLAGIDKKIPLHITRFFPSFHMRQMRPTSLALIDELVSIAREQLDHVYKGNC